MSKVKEFNDTISSKGYYTYKNVTRKDTLVCPTCSKEFIIDKEEYDGMITYNFKYVIFKCSHCKYSDKYEIEFNDNDTVDIMYGI